MLYLIEHLIYLQKVITPRLFFYNIILGDRRTIRQIKEKKRKLFHSQIYESEEAMKRLYVGTAKVCIKRGSWRVGEQGSQFYQLYINAFKFIEYKVQFSIRLSKHLNPI